MVIIEANAVYGHATVMIVLKAAPITGRAVMHPR